MRKIIHIDMDAFYASVEQRDNPELRGKPVAVGWDKERSVVCTASYEARKFGVRSALPAITARKKCPELIFVKPNFEKYHLVSHQIRSVFQEYTDLIEPLSLDEAYLDVTENKLNISSATQIANEIKDKIKLLTGLTASAGVSYNKFLAKIASDYQKPDGLFVIKPSEAQMFIDNLEVDKFFGVGKVTAAKMLKMGIKTGADLKKLSLIELSKYFGKSGAYYYEIVRGNDNRQVISERERKSIGTEYTFDKDLTEKFQIIAELYKIEKHLIDIIEKQNTYGRTLTLKVKYADFRQITRSITLNAEINTFNLLHKASRNLLKSVEYNNTDKKVRLLGLSISNFDHIFSNSKQMTLKLD